MWRRPRQTNLKALVNLGSCHSHRKSAPTQSVWRRPAFCEGTFHINMSWGRDEDSSRKASQPQGTEGWQWEVQCA